MSVTTESRGISGLVNHHLESKSNLPPENSKNVFEIPPIPVSRARKRKPRLKSLMANRRFSVVPAQAVQESFKRAILNMDAQKHNSTERGQDEHPPTTMLGSILKVLSQKNVPKIIGAPSTAASVDNSELPQGDDKSSIEMIQNIKVEEIEISNMEDHAGQFQPDSDYETQTYEETGDEILGLDSESDPLSNNNTEEAEDYPVTVKLEVDDMLHYPNSQQPGIISHNLSQEEGEEDGGHFNSNPNQEQAPPYFEAFDDNEEMNSNVQQDSATPYQKVVVVTRIRKERKCRVCGELFFSGDGLATHLYSHIPHNNNYLPAVPPKKPRRKMSSNPLDVNSRTHKISVPKNLLNNTFPHDSSEGMIDPLSIVSTTTSKVEVESKDNILVDADVKPLVRNGEIFSENSSSFKLNLQHLKSFAVPPPSKTCKRKTVSTKTGKRINIKTKAPRARTPVQKFPEKEKLFSPTSRRRREENSICSFGFGDVISKLVKKKEILSSKQRK